ncbi:unnamed protein product [Orchesella dallaii]|uniref:Uncharacterized protein n=1 Tax=Orchesella dallaii TaxID=48710 RepID=A0ABP1PWD0_9HEXA
MAQTNPAFLYLRLVEKSNSRTLSFTQHLPGLGGKDSATRRVDDTFVGKDCSAEPSYTVFQRWRSGGYLKTLIDFECVEPKSKFAALTQPTNEGIPVRNLQFQTDMEKIFDVQNQIAQYFQLPINVVDRLQRTLGTVISKQCWTAYFSVIKIILMKISRS